MSAKDNGGSAFPWCGDLNDCPTIQLGMTLRDYFAAKAMQSILHVAFENGHASNPDDSEKLSMAAYIMADAMLAERSK